MKMTKSGRTDNVCNCNNRLGHVFGIKSRAKWIAGFMTALFIVVICLSASSVVWANNKKEETIYIYYTSIEIQPGDSLWSIASKYCFDMNMGVNDYINEIKELNHLSSDVITSGQYLTVMYVSGEYK